MLKVVPDVNVWVSSLLQPRGHSARIYRAWRQNELEVVTSWIIIHKIVEVVYRPHIWNKYPIGENTISSLRQTIVEEATITPQELDLNIVEEDPEDNTIIIAAVEGAANAIISGDPHLLQLQSYQDIPILSPAAFVEQYKIP